MQIGCSQRYQDLKKLVRMELLPVMFLVRSLPKSHAFTHITKSENYTT